MIIWLASYPRSGNTFTRIVLHHVYGVPTFTEDKAADDLSHDRGSDAGKLTGNRYIEELYPNGKYPEDFESFIEDLDAREEIFFIKTHRSGKLIGRTKNLRTILLVRHPTDVMVSLANYHMDVLYTMKRFWQRVKGLKLSRTNKNTLPWLWSIFKVTAGLTFQKTIGRRDPTVLKLFENNLNHGSWEYFHRTWLDERESGDVAIVRFPDLIQDPVQAMAKALEELGLDLKPVGGTVPTFEELKAVHPTFFRKGKSGAGKKEIPQALVESVSTKFGSRITQLGLDKQ